MATTIEAVYEGGIFRPVTPVDLAEGTRVEVHAIEELADEGGLSEIFTRIAALPIQGKTDPFSGEDHDKALYGKESAT